MEGALIAYQIIPKDRKIEAEFELEDILMILSKKFPGIEKIEKYLVELPFRGLLLLDLTNFTKNLSEDKKKELRKALLEEFEKAKQDGRARNLVKIIPFDKIVKTDLKEIERAIAELAYKVRGKWRITLRRRGTVPFSRKEIITSAAKPIDASKYPVDLKNPDYVIYIDCFGDLTGILVATNDEAAKLKLKSS